MKYTNQINFVLMAAAVAFSIYVFSETFMRPPADLPSQPASGTPSSRLEEGSSDPEAGPRGRGAGPEAESDPFAGASQERPGKVAGQQGPSRDRRTTPPTTTRNPARPPGDRPRPAARPDRTEPRPRPGPSDASLPSGAIIPNPAPARSPSSRRPSAPASVGSVQGGRPLPLRDRGGSKRQADPNSPLPRGSRQQ
ncbi:MAG: hypothetical protein V3T83_06660 [Acidobacteriota bacterium]